MRIVVRDGHALAVRVEGRGPDLLLVHGFTGSSAAWGEQRIAALARRFRVIAPDLLGHGDSSTRAPAARYALPAQVEDLCGVLAALGCERALWAGYSMGGRISLAAAVLAPERVRALLLEGASPGLPSAAEREQRRAADEKLAAGLEADGIEPFVTRWMSLPLFATQSRLAPKVRAAERARRLANDPRALAASLRGAGTGVQDSYWHALPDVRVPALVIAGVLDTKFTALGQQMVDALPDAELRLAPDCGHCVHLERPEAWLGAIHDLDARART